MSTKTKLKTVEKNGNAKVPKPDSVWHRCITAGSEWTDKVNPIIIIRILIT